MQKEKSVILILSLLKFQIFCLLQTSCINFHFLTYCIKFLLILLIEFLAPPKFCRCGSVSPEGMSPCAPLGLGMHTCGHHPPLLQIGEEDCSGPQSGPQAIRTENSRVLMMGSWAMDDRWVPVLRSMVSLPLKKRVVGGGPKEPSEEKFSASESLRGLGKVQITQTLDSAALRWGPKVSISSVLLCAAAGGSRSRSLGEGSPSPGPRRYLIGFCGWAFGGAEHSFPDLSLDLCQAAYPECTLQGKRWHTFLPSWPIFSLSLLLMEMSPGCWALLQSESLLQIFFPCKFLA